MAVEADAEHVEALPLVPVGRRPDIGDARGDGVGPVQGHLEAHPGGGLEGQEVVNQGVIRIAGPLPAGGFIHRGEVFQAQKPGRGFGLEKAQDLLEPGLGHRKGRHVGGLGRGLNRVAEFFLEHLGQGLGALVQFDAGRRRGPHHLGAALPKPGRGHRGPPGGRAVIAGAPGVPGFVDAVHRQGPLGPLGAALEVEDFPGRPLGHHLFLELHQALQDRLGPGRAAGNIDVHRHDLVHPLDHAVAVVHAAAVGAGPHGDHPLGLRHLLVEPEHHRGDFFEDRAGDDQQVGLPGRTAQDFRPEPGHVIPRRERGGFLDKTAG